MADKEKLEELVPLVKALQDFDATSLDRSDDLGKQLSFTDIVVDAKNIIALYNKLPLDVIGDLSNTQLDEIKRQADSDGNLFHQVMSFEATRSDAAAARTSIINQIKSRRDTLFQVLLPFINYGFTKNTDVSSLQAKVNETIGGIEKQVTSLVSGIEKNKGASETALAAIRSVAAENGVSQQAFYFRDEANEEEKQASIWLSYVKRTSIIIAIFVILNLFLHKCSWLAPTTQIEAIQFIASKALIFIFLAYVLVLSARNYSAHKHNAIVNRHRQNALQTYKTLVEAGVEKVTQDIVLAHAASCIFSPQETAFSSSKGDASGAKSVLELMTKSTKTPE